MASPPDLKYLKISNPFFNLILTSSVRFWYLPCFCMILQIGNNVLQHLRSCSFLHTSELGGGIAGSFSVDDFGEQPFPKHGSFVENALFPKVRLVGSYFVPGYHWNLVVGWFSFDSWRSANWNTNSDKYSHNLVHLAHLILIVNKVISYIPVNIEVLFHIFCNRVFGAATHIILRLWCNTTLLRATIRPTLYSENTKRKRTGMK